LRFKQTIADDTPCFDPDQIGNPPLIEIKAPTRKASESAAMDDRHDTRCNLKQACDADRDPPSAYLVDKYDARVPRYTSYPTAVNFRPDIGPDRYESWLAGLAPNQPLSLYIHIPFCQSLCWYCGCHTGVARGRKPLAAYLQTLMREIELVSEAIPHRPRLATLHLGGGSPNMLSTLDLASLFTCLRENFAFDEQAVIAAELDPRSLNSEWIKVAADLGLNRASLGVQDLDPAVQAAINRIQPLGMIESSIEALRREGVNSINLDIVYGLPRQTTHGLAMTIEQIVGLEPDRVALFGYAHVPWMMPRQKLIRDDQLPDARQRYRQQLVAANKLEEAGYLRIGLDHFALPTDDLAIAAENGLLKRNFQGYTSDEGGTLIGLGASSISTFGQGFAQNTLDIGKWRAAVDKGQFATNRGVVLTNEDRFRAEIIQRLMCDLEVDFIPILRKWEMPVAILGSAFASLRQLQVDGLVRQVGSVLTVTRLGRPFLRTICASFDQYIASSDPVLRHARSI
jgi:oxygen-independent coproporphyrinogen III oxidase